MRTFTSCVSTTLVLLLLGLVVLFGLSAHNLSNKVRENLTVTLLLDDDLDKADTDTLRMLLDARPYVAAMTYISKEQALEEEMERLGTNPTEFLGEGENPYTASIEMNVQADYACTDSLVWISNELRSMWQVTDVVYQKELVDNLNQLLRRITLVLAALAVLLMIISVFLIHTTVRLSVYARRFSIHTMRLVGASWAFIRWPFIRQSVGIGLVAAVVAISLLAAGLWWAIQKDPFVQTVVTPTVIAIMAGAVLLAAVLLTIVCTWLSVNHFLRMRENEMYR